MFSLRSAIVDNLITMSCKLNRKPFGLRPLSSAEASLCESEAGKKKKAHGERWEGLSVRFTMNAVGCKQIQNGMMSMARGKGPGIDKIPIRVIKDCLPAHLISVNIYHKWLVTGLSGVQLGL